MKFAKVVFWIAFIWGVLILTPLYFMFDVIGRQDPPPITHPAFYYGFVETALAWQIAFLIIASDPARFRPIIVAAIVEKFSYAAALIVLYLQSRLHASDLMFAGAGLIFGMLFLVAYLKAKT
jgi:Na+-transporting methylmalonyl-CoA/oxaloacetate decarboxylase gamma subunit